MMLKRSGLVRNLMAGKLATDRVVVVVAGGGGGGVVVTML